MYYRTILSSSFKSRTVLFLLQPPFLKHELGIEKNSIFVTILLMGWNYSTHLNRAYSKYQWTKQAVITSKDSQYGTYQLKYAKFKENRV